MKRKKSQADLDDSQSKKRRIDSFGDSSPVITVPDIATLIAQHLDIHETVNWLSCSRELRKINDDKKFWDDFLGRYLCTSETKSDFIRMPWHRAHEVHLVVALEKELADEEDVLRVQHCLDFVEATLRPFNWASFTLRTFEEAELEGEEKLEKSESNDGSEDTDQEKDGPELKGLLAELREGFPENTVVLSGTISPGYLCLGFPRLLHERKGPTRRKIGEKEFMLPPFTVVGTELSFDFDVPKTLDEFRVEFEKGWRNKSDFLMADAWLGAYLNEIRRSAKLEELLNSYVERDLAFTGVELGMAWDKFNDLYPAFAEKPGHSGCPFIVNGLCGTLTAVSRDAQLSRLRWQFVCDSIKDLQLNDIQFMKAAFDAIINTIGERRSTDVKDAQVVLFKISTNGIKAQLAGLTPEALQKKILKQDEMISEEIQNFGIRCLKHIPAKTFFEQEFGNFKALIYCFPNRWTGSVEFALAVELNL